MYSKLALINARRVLGALAACGLFVGGVAAQDHVVTVSTKVDARGLDLTQPADAQTFYKRLRNAAWMLCTRSTRVGLAPVDNLQGCYEQALGDAVRTSHSTIVTQIYLGTHTLRDAAARGIEVPAQVAAK